MSKLYINIALCLGVAVLLGFTYKLGSDNGKAKIQVQREKDKVNFQLELAKLKETNETLLAEVKHESEQSEKTFLASTDQYRHDISGLRKQLSNLSTHNRALSIKQGSSADTFRADTYDLLTNMSDGLVSEGSELATYADRLKLRLDNCVKEHNALNTK